MLGLGDGVVVLMSAVALIYGIYMVISKRLPLYFQLSIGVIACLMLGYIFDICDYIVNGVLTRQFIPRVQSRLCFTMQQAE